MALSQNKLIASGAVKRADALTIDYDDIQVMPGFNGRDMNSQSFSDSIRELSDHITAGGYYPPLVIRFFEDGSNHIVDGHRRYYALGEARYQGFEIGRIRVERFEGDDAQAKAMIITSADARELTPLEQAKVVYDLQGMGKTTKEIATLINKTVSRVEQLLKLADAPAAVKEKVKAGKVSAAHATEMVRQHGDGAELILDIQEKEARAQGKEKITAKTLKAYKPKVADYEAAVKSLYDSMSEYGKSEFRDDNAELGNMDRAMITLFKMAGVDYKTLPVQGEE